MHCKTAVLAMFAFLVFGLSAYAAEPDACSLLTTAQVSEALGVSVAAGQHIPASNLRSCGWNAQGSSSLSAKRVVLSLESARNWAVKKAPVDGISKTPVAGIGEDAIYITTPPFGTGLNVKKGDVAFIVRVYGLPKDEMLAKEKTLAGAVLKKL